MTFGNLIARTLAAATALLASEALAAPVFTTLTSPVFAEALPGPDGFLGTADDLAAPGFNLSGTASHVEFATPSLGSFASFATGTFTFNSPLAPIPGGLAATDFDILLSNEQTNGFTSTSVDVPSVVPHELGFTFPGIIEADYTLLNSVFSGAIMIGTLEADLSLTGFTLLAGVDPALLPGIDTATADYLTLLTTIAPAGWTAISLTADPFTSMTADNTRGTLAALFIGGQARGVTALYTMDPFSIPEPAPTVLVATAAVAAFFPLSIKRRS